MSTIPILSLVSSIGFKARFKTCQLIYKLRRKHGQSVNCRHFSFGNSFTRLSPRGGVSGGARSGVPAASQDFNSRSKHRTGQGPGQDGSGSSVLPWYESNKVETVSGISGRRALDSDNSINNYLEQQIQTFKQPKDLLDFIESNEVYMFEPSSVDVACKTLFTGLKKDQLSPADKKRLLTSVGMQKLFRVIKKHCRHLVPEELLNVTKIFVYLNAPESNPTFQIVLRLLSKQVNQISLTNILYLCFLMDQMAEESRSSLSQALQIALPIVFESQLNIQLDDVNLWELADCLQFAVKSNSSEKTIKRILEPICEKQMHLTYKQAHSIIWSLGDCKIYLPESYELVDTCFKILTTNISLFDRKQLCLFVSYCSNRSRVRVFDHLYNDDFIEAACNRMVAVQDEHNSKLILSFFKSVSVIRHMNIELMETVADMIATNPKILLNDDSLFVGVIKGFSGGAYKPEKWDSLVPLLVEHPAMCNGTALLDISLALDFLALDVLPSTLLQRIFSPEYFSSLNNWLDKSGPFTLIMIYNAIKHLHPDYEGPLPPSSMVERWKNKSKTVKENSKNHQRLEGALQVALGGEAYFINGIVHEGIYIDYCVVMRQGGYPIAVKDRNPITLDDIERPENSFLILIKSFEREAYSSNTKRLRGIHCLESKILRSFGHAVMEVDMWSFRQLMDAEKIPWLMRQLNEHKGKAPTTYFDQ